MAEHSDGAIVIDTALNNSGFTSGAKQLRQQVDGLKNAVNSAGKTMANAGNGFTQSMNNATKGARTATAEMKQLQERAVELNRNMDRMRREGITDANREQFASMKSELASVRDRMNELVRTGQAWEAEATQTAAGLSEVTARTEQAAAAADHAAGSFAKVIGARIVGGFKKLGGVIGTFAKKLIGMNGTLQSSGAGFNLGFKSILKYAFGIRSLFVLFNRLRTAIADGLKNMTKHDSVLKKSLDGIKNSLTQVKNALATAFAPIIKAVAPALIKMINLLATAINYIAAFIAALTGAGKYKRALPVGGLNDAGAAAAGAAENTAAMGAAMSGAADDAKDLKRQLAGFDQLNVLSKDSGGGGGGGGGGSPGGGFEDTPIDSALTDFAQRLRDAFNNADWQTLGTLLAEKFNAIIDSIDWAGIGQKIGYWFNAAIQSLYWFLDGIDFVNIGARVAELLNNALSEVDFEYIGRLLIKKSTIVWDLLIGFFTELDWGQIASKLSDGIIGIFDEFSEWLDGIDWTTMGETLYQKLKDFISNIDFAGLAKGFFTALGTAIKSAAMFLGGFLGNIVEDIKTWWDNDIKGADWKETAGNLLTAIGKGFKNIGSWVWTNIIDPFGKALLGEKWDELKALGAKIWNKIKTGWNSVKDKVVTFTASVINNAKEWWSNVKTWWTTTTLGEKLADVKTFITNNVSAMWTSLKAWWTTATVGQRLSSVATWITNNVKGMWDSVKTWWYSSTVGQRLTSVATWIVNNIKGMWDSVKTWWYSTTLGQRLTSVATWIINNVSQMWTSLKTWWATTTFAQRLSDVRTYIANNASTMWESIKTWWKNTIGSGSLKDVMTHLTNNVSTMWSNLKTWWANTVSSLSIVAKVSDNIKTWWASMKKWWNDNVIAKFKIKLPTVKVTWKKDPIFGKIDIPSFSIIWNAKGGILDGAQLFGMLGNTLLGGGEAGKEAVLPLERNTGWMDTLAEHVWNYHAPNVASGSLMPYEVAAQIAQTGADIQTTMNANSEDIIQTIISVIATQTSALVSAIRSSGSSSAGGASAQDIINEINRRSQMFAASPLRG